MVWFRQVCTESPTFYRVKYANTIKFSGFFYVILKALIFLYVKNFADVKSKRNSELHDHQLAQDLSRFIFNTTWLLYVHSKTDFHFCIYQTFFFSSLSLDPSLYINVMFIVVHLFFEIVTALFQIPRTIKQINVCTGHYERVL